MCVCVFSSSSYCVCVIAVTSVCMCMYVGVGVECMSDALFKGGAYAQV